MPHCSHDLELISAFLDGETTPEETAQVQMQLRECADCRSFEQAVHGLTPQVAQLSDLPLTADFAKTTARFVRARVPNKPVDRVSSYRPMDVLQRSGKGGYAAFGAMHVFAFLLCVVPTVLLNCLQDRIYLDVFLGALSLLIMIGLPLRHLSTNVSRLNSLIKGRALEEMLSVGLQPEEILDGLATSQLKNSLQACGLVAPLLILGSFTVPPPIRPLALALSTVWLPAVAAIYWALSFLAAWLAVWAPAPRARMLAIFAMSSPLLLTPYLSKAVRPFLTISLLDIAVFCLCLLLFNGIVCRRMTLWGLKHSDTLRRWGNRGQLGRRNSSVSMFSNNPITRRELSRLSSSLSGGWLGLLAWRFGMLGLPLLWGGWALSHTGVADVAWTFWSGLGLFGTLFFFRGALLSLGSVIQEREQGSWETLLQSHIGVSLFVKGWLQLAVYTNLLQGVLAVLALASYGFIYQRQIVTPDSAASGGLIVVAVSSILLMASSVLGALVGLAVSASSRNRSESGSALLRVVLLAVIGALLTWAGMAVVCAVGSDTHTPAFQELVDHELVLATAILVGLALGWWSKATLMRDLFSIELRQLERTEERRYPLSLLLGELAAPGFVAYITALLCLLINSSQAAWLQPATLALFVSIVWVVAVRTPLASLAELLQGRRASLLLGPGSGALFGLSLVLGLSVLSGSLRIAPQDRLSQVLQQNWTMTICITAIFGLAFGLVSARAFRPREARSVLLKRRLRNYAVIAGGFGLLLATYGYVCRSDWQLSSVAEMQVQEARTRQRIYVQKLEMDRKNHKICWPERAPFLRENRERLYNPRGDYPDRKHMSKAAKNWNDKAIRACTKLYRDLQPALNSPECEDFIYFFVPELLYLANDRRAEHGHEAAEIYRDCLRIAEGSENKGDSLSAFESIRYQKQVLEEIIQWVNSGQVGRQELLLLREQFEKSRAKEGRLADTLVNEIVNDQLIQYSSFPIPEFLRTLKRVQRDEALLALVRSMDLSRLASLRQRILSDDLTASFDKKCAPVPGLCNLLEQTDLKRKLLEAACLLTDLQLYRLEHGHWPKSLEELQVERPTGVSNIRFNYEVSGDSMTLRESDLGRFTYRVQQYYPVYENQSVKRGK